MTSEAFWGLVAKTDGCWIWTGLVDHRGYGRLSWRGKNWRLAHRVSLELSGVDPGSACALHHCDNPLCVNPAHLFLGTRADNNRDMVSKGRHARGERHGSKTKPESVPRGERSGRRKHPESYAHVVPWAKLHPELVRRGADHHFRIHPESHPRGERVGGSKLNDDKVREIRRRAADGERLYLIAEDFGVSDVLVSRIVRRKQWAHVT